MDVAMVVASHVAPAAFATDEIGLRLIGRWAGGLLHGRLRHEAIVTEQPIGGEVAVGVAVHYLTGTILTVGYLEAMRRTGHEPRLASATAYCLATGALPLLVMYPAMGLGCCGAALVGVRTDDPPVQRTTPDMVVVSDLGVRQPWLQRATRL